MLARSLPLLRVFVVVLVVALVIVLGALGWVILFDQNSDTPRTEAERSLLAAEQAVKANPESATSRVKLAAAYIEQGRFGDATEQAEIAVRLSPDDPSAYYILGKAQDAGGNASAAIASLEKAAGLEGQIAAFYQDVYVALARVHEKAGNDEAALSSMDTAIDFGPENAILLFERGQIHESQGNWSFALLDYAWALDYVPNYEPALNAFSNLSAAHPEALGEVRQWQEQGQEEATETAPGS
ncbi:MAG: tetratricopeptide repeat protein [Thermoleophilia bacterium]